MQPLGASTLVPDVAPSNSRKGGVRVPLACRPCRLGKLKCDRNSPCQACIARERTDACQYWQKGSSGQTDGSRAISEGWAPPAAVVRSPGQMKPVRRRSSDKAGPNDTKSRLLNNRLQTLEAMVAELIAKNEEISESPHGESGVVPSESTSPNELAGSEPIYGTDSGTRMVFKNSEQTDRITRIEEALEGAIYEKDGRDLSSTVGDGSLAEDTLKASRNVIMNQSQRVKMAQMAQNSHAFSLFPSTISSLSQLIVSLPPRALVQNLVNEYIGSFRIFFNIVHKPTLLRELDDFWLSPAGKIDPAWFAFLCIICSYSLRQLSHKRARSLGFENAARAREVAEDLETCSGKALLFGNYLERPSLDTVRTLFTMSINSILAGRLKLCIAVYGTAIAQAQMLSLNRDPAQLPNIKNIEAETRRRVFWSLWAWDKWLMPEAGRCYFVHDGHWDVELPANAEDSEISDDRPLLSKPLQIPTSGAIFFYSREAAALNAQMEDRIFLSRDHCYDDVLEFDKKWRQVIREKPAFLQWPPADLAVPAGLDTSSTSVRSLASLRVLSHIGALDKLLKLHRPYFSKALNEPRLSYSRMACVDIAKEMLRAFHSVAKSPDDQSTFWVSQAHSFNAAMTLALSVFQEPDCLDRFERIELASLVCADLELLIQGGHVNSGVEGAKILRHFVNKLEFSSPATLNAQFEQQQYGMVGKPGADFSLMDDTHLSTVGFEGEIWEMLINNWIMENPLMKEAQPYGEVV